MPYLARSVVDRCCCTTVMSIITAHTIIITHSESIIWMKHHVRVRDRSNIATRIITATPSSSRALRASLEYIPCFVSPSPCRACERGTLSHRQSRGRGASRRQSRYQTRSTLRVGFPCRAHPTEVSPEASGMRRARKDVRRRRGEKKRRRCRERGREECCVCVLCVCVCVGGGGVNE
jgi:hypothetical protein